MRPTSSRSRRTSAAEDGFTLVEMVITTSLLVTILGALLTVFLGVQRSSAYVEDRTQNLDAMRLTVNRMTKEIRQAITVSASSTASRLEMDTYVQGVLTTIVYQAGGTTVTRSQGGNPAVTIQDNLASTSLFLYTPDVNDVRVVFLELQVRPARQPETTLVVRSEVRLRNQGLAP